MRLVPVQGRLFGDIANLKALLRIFSPYTYQGAYALGQRLGQPGMPMYLTVSCARISTAAVPFWSFG